MHLKALKTVVTEDTNVEVDTGKTGNVAYLGNNASLQDLVNALNSLGVNTQDLITIFTNH